MSSRDANDGNDHEEGGGEDGDNTPGYIHQGNNYSVEPDVDQTMDPMLVATLLE
uniref:Uncharacterized protein n=1 Tax=Cucumis melo TaxID=3656 RepID=A0A9I9D7X1_CUCME